MSEHDHKNGEEHVHDENCNHDHDHEEHVFLVTDEEGKEREMVMVYTFESEEQVYAVLLDRMIQKRTVLFSVLKKKMARHSWLASKMMQSGTV